MPLASPSKKSPISRAESLSGTCHKVGHHRSGRRPSWNACRSPATPSPLRTWPRPVSQAESTTKSGTAQVHADDLQAGQHAIILPQHHPVAMIAAGQEQAASQQRVLRQLALLGQRRQLCALLGGTILRFHFLIFEEEAVRAQDNDLGAVERLDHRLQRIPAPINPRSSPAYALQLRFDVAVASRPVPSSRPTLPN